MPANVFRCFSFQFLQERTCVRFHSSTALVLMVQLTKLGAHPHQNLRWQDFWNRGCHVVPRKKISPSCSLARFLRGFNWLAFPRQFIFLCLHSFQKDRKTEGARHPQKRAHESRQMCPRWTEVCEALVQFTNVFVGVTRFMSEGAVFRAFCKFIHIFSSKNKPLRVHVVQKEPGLCKIVVN